MKYLAFLGFFLNVKDALACTVCFSPLENDPANVALRASILVLLGVTFTTLGFFARFFLNVRKREKGLFAQKDNP